jgi:hypothetical protein
MSDNGVIIFLVMTIVAGVVLMIAAMNNRRKIREMEHRERLAMIERGVVPSPETNPAAFEAAAGFADDGRKDGVEPGYRYRTAGVLLIGIGLGLIFLIGVGAGKDIGWGIGGAWISLGAACLLNYWLIARRDEETRRGRWIPPARRPDPPTNIAP